MYLISFYTRLNWKFLKHKLSYQCYLNLPVCITPPSSVFRHVYSGESTIYTILYKIEVKISVIRWSSSNSWPVNATIFTYALLLLWQGLAVLRHGNFSQIHHTYNLYIRVQFLHKIKVKISVTERSSSHSLSDNATLNLHA